MATKPKSQILLFTTISALLLLTVTAAAGTDFIKASCAATTYPALCIHSLTPYAPSIKTSTRRLAVTALTVSLSTAQSTKAYVRKLQPSKPREAAAVKDCAEEIEDTVDRLSRSIKELKAMGKGGAAAEEFQWHLSNIETWVSAALTDENTCVDGFGGKVMDGEMKDGIRVRFLKTAKVTSNALALINKYGRRH
ncbi:Pectinesterase inhibitor 11 [Linum grandiflorum]